jgi:hypothetical protein
MPSTKEQISDILGQLLSLTEGVGVVSELVRLRIEILRAEHTRLGAQLLAETNQGEFQFEDCHNCTLLQASNI